MALNTLSVNVTADTGAIAPATPANPAANKADAAAGTPVATPLAGFGATLQRAAVADTSTPALPLPLPVTPTGGADVKLPVDSSRVAPPELPAQAAKPAADDSQDAIDTGTAALQPDWPALSPLLASLMASASAAAAAATSTAPAPAGNTPRPAPAAAGLAAVGKPVTANAAATQAATPGIAPTPVAATPVQAPSAKADVASPALQASVVDAADADDASAALPSVGSATAAAPSRQEMSTSLALPAGPDADLRQPLRQALGPRLAWQADQRSEQAQLRLSPPQLGHIDIQIRHEGGSLQVQLSASHAEVARQLAQVSDGLRQDLSQRHAGEVRVQVGQGAANGSDFGQSGRQQPQRTTSDEAQAPGRALAEADAETGTATTPFRLRKG
ncbi:flagellar hook-length control protein FliK [Ideonella azotifigens]|uniref:Flagellar hook-length control protein-like C-terminal domain-containing protein n=1 Tax=Ideonella azotifigens TaxID=513160 RepID=A0ABN1K948_9BURK|nr:flagellar hook-length control protein FliK [Ideonella azotifigens]